MMEECKHVARIICGKYREGLVQGVYFHIPISLFADIVGSIQSSRLGVCHQMQSEVYLRVYSGMCSRVFCEIAWKCIVKLAGSI